MKLSVLIGVSHSKHYSKGIVLSLNSHRRNSWIRIRNK